MNDKDLKELKEVHQSSRQTLRELERLITSLIRQEDRMLQLVKADVDYLSPFTRELDRIRAFQRTIRDHNLIAKVGRLIPELERDQIETSQTVREVRDELKESMVQVGDTQMTLGTLLRALEKMG